jgi:hypothetical protein
VSPRRKLSLRHNRRRYKYGEHIIGILGSGVMGSKQGTLFARAGHEVIRSYSRNSKKLEQLAKEAGAHAHAGTPADATQGADAVLQTRCTTCRLCGQVDASAQNTKVDEWLRGEPGTGGTFPSFSANGDW